ncbi:pentapeptide repeat-containing protein [Streptomyces sp. NPDC046876]|uniref:pentapeptide repeat-containing protein n=1 Tax=Streptomyces sp. NPDC046876 TaxID=3155616 RepID=UPI00340D381D
MLPGVAALAAVLFSWIQVGQVSKELRISDEGQITNRFNTAIGHLGASSMHVRIGGIYALNRIVQDSQRDNPAVTSVLSAYIREEAPLATKKPAQSEKYLAPPDDVSAALAVLANRPESPWPSIANLRNVNLRGLETPSVPLLSGSNARNFRKADLSGSDLHDSKLDEFDFEEADFSSADFSDAWLTRSDLHNTTAMFANFTNATFVGSDLSGTRMDSANLTGAFFSEAAGKMWVGKGSSEHTVGSANLTAAILPGVNFTRADLRGVNLKKAWLGGANFTDANLTGANLQGATLADDTKRYGTGVTRLTRISLVSADLRNADLRGADLRNADLRGADLRGAKLAGARIKGAKIDKHTRGLPASTV